MAYRRWLSTLAFEHPAQQIAFQDYVDAVMDGARSRARTNQKGLLLGDRLGDRRHGGVSPPIVLFRYAAGAAGAFAEQFLRGFKGDSCNATATWL
ncbi:hypothetical protein [Mesorhizobium sp. L-8-3]|uniref:hypothetical protein n=1 Tax=Mesorhizobium sp. L-8-3 TaxID=2744522 RepID=UPI001FD10F2B|nr:hypothetical protein [Mesorhizobium sp. L-8-3]